LAEGEGPYEFEMEAFRYNQDPLEVKKDGKVDEDMKSDGKFAKRMSTASIYDSNT
jgi:hypothetical protein